MTTPRPALLFVAAALACGRGEAPPASADASSDAAAYRPPDPCGLLTQAEAEAVLGALAGPPQRTRRGTATPDTAGSSCAYATAGGRALVLTPEWTYGKSELDAERLVGELVSQVANIHDAVADTLEGSWDDVVLGVSGDLVMRKGPRSLSISYDSSSTDLAGAIRLSGPALARLAAVPEPPRPKVSADGCPLSPEVVSELLGMPVRLAPSPVQQTDACAYPLVEDPTVEVELAIHPGAIGDMVFDEITMRARAALGSTAEPGRLDLGEGGIAWGSMSGSEAAARAGGKVYHAKLMYPLSMTTQSQEAAMVRMVARMIP